MSRINSESSDTYEKQLAGAAALRFVYPGIRVNATKLTPEVVGWALLMARALDRTSRVTYGVFEFYRTLATGAFKRALTWTDIASGVARGVLKQLDGGAKKNRVSEAVIHMQFPQRAMQQHLDDPDTHPLITPVISVGSPLDRFVWGLSE